MSCFQQKPQKPTMATPTKEPITIQPTKTTPSSFINITTPNSNIRIRVPKLLAKTIKTQPKNKTMDNTNNSTKDRNRKINHTNLRNSSPKKQSLRDLFGSKRMDSPSEKREEAIENWKREVKRGLGYYNDKNNNTKQSNNDGKKSINVLLFLTSIFSRKKSLDTAKAEKSESCYAGNNTCKLTKFPIIKGANNMENEVAQEREGKGEGELYKKRVLMGGKCKPLNSRGKLTRFPIIKDGGNDMKNEETEARVVVDREEKREVELCKKRILMGEKCKPLNSRRVLKYDSNGVLLPEC